MTPVQTRCWKGGADREVDLVAEVGGEIIPFEIKYRSEHTSARELRGLAEFCAGKKIARAYVMTKALNDFGEMEKLPGADTRIMKVPRRYSATGSGLVKCELIWPQFGVHKTQATSV